MRSAWKTAECDDCGKVRSCQTFEIPSFTHEPPECVEICFLCQKTAERAERAARAERDERADRVDRAEAAYQAEMDALEADLEELGVEKYPKYAGLGGEADAEERTRRAGKWSQLKGKESGNGAR